MNINFRPLKHEYCPSRRKITYFQLLIYSQGFATAGSSAYLFFFTNLKLVGFLILLVPKGLSVNAANLAFEQQHMPTTH